MFHGVDPSSLSASHALPLWSSTTRSSRPDTRRDTDRSDRITVLPGGGGRGRDKMQGTVTKKKKLMKIYL